MRYKDHKTLGLTFAEYGALLGVRTMLDLGLLKHSSSTEVVPKKHLFNMSTSCRVEGCGSVACIGGAMGIILYCGRYDGYDLSSRVSGYVDSTTGPLHDLFYPPSGGNVKFDYSDVPNEVAVKAIDQFLTGRKISYKRLMHLYNPNKY